MARPATLAAPFGAPAAAPPVPRLRAAAEEVLDGVLPTLFDAMGELARTEAALAALAGAFAPPALARLREIGTGFAALADAVGAEAATARAQADGLAARMRGGRARLDELGRLARSASLVALNAQVVSGAIRADDGALDGLARTMRAVLLELGALVAELGRGFDRGEAELAQLARAAADLGGLARREAVPAIQRFAALVEGRARDRALARSAEVVSARLAQLQGRIRGVVTHLQAGDSFRQRLEHAEAILERADAGTDAAPLLRRIAGRQVRAAAADLGQALDRGRRDLRALGRLAGAIPAALAQGGFRGPEAGGLAPLLRGARAIEGAVDALAAAGRDLAEASGALSRALGGVGQASRAAAGYETRMTVLGLNAILLSQRLGHEGRAMVEVAQQLRDLARALTEEVGRLRRDTEGVAEAAAAREGGDALGRHLAGALAATAEVSRLAGVVAAQLAEMSAARSASEIAQAFAAAEARLAAFAAELPRLAAEADRLDPPGPAPAVPDAARSALAAARGLYTMQAERAVHDAFAPPPEPAPAPPHAPVPATALVDDDGLFG